MNLLCPNCGKKNKSTNIKCEFCSSELNKEEKESESNKITLEQKICMVCGLVAFGAIVIYGIYIICSSVYFLTTEKKIKKEYSQKYATLMEYTDCQFNEDKQEVCNAIYKYDVNDKTYTVSLESEVARDAYQKSEIVYYNPSNPSDSVIYPSNNNYDVVRIIAITSGIVYACVGIFAELFIISIYKMLKKPKQVL